MTIASTLAKAGPYSCDGAQTEFPFAFRVLDPSCVTVYLDDVQVADGFTVELAETGGTVKFAEAPAKGGVLAILRETPFDQQTDLQDNQAFLPEVLETSLDKLTMQTQELKEQMERAVTVPPTSLISPGEYLQVNIKIAEQAKDICLSSATAAANSAQTAATCERNISLIWGELSGDPTLAENALLTLKEAAEATGAVTAAAEIAKGEIVNTGAVALASVRKATEEAKEAAEVATNTAGSITGTVADQITIQVSQAVGADGVLGVAISEAEKVINDAKNELEQAQTNGMTELTDAQKAALAQIQGKVDAVSIDVQAAIERANVIAQGYLDNAKNTTDQAIEDLTNIRDNAIAAGDSALAEIAQKRLEVMQEISAGLSDAQSARDAALAAQEAAAGSSSSASGSASSAAGSAQEALKAYQDALAKAQEAAKSASDAEASRLAAESTATNVVNSSLVLHNASAEAHPGMFVKRVGDADITGNLTLTGEGKGGLFASSVASGSIDAAMLFSTNGAVESRVTDGSGDPYYRWFNGTAATDIRMIADGTLCTWNNFAKKHVAFKAKSLELEGESPEEATLRLVATNIAWSELFLNSESHLCIRTPGSPSINGILHAGELVLEGVGAVGATLASMSAGRTSYPNYAAGLDVKSAYNDNAKSYTFPSDGWVLAYPASSGKMYINGGSVPVVKSSDASQECVFIPVRAGDTISGSTANFMAFFPNR